MAWARTGSRKANIASRAKERLRIEILFFKIGSSAVLGLDGDGIMSSSVNTITCRLDISDYNAGIQLIFGKMIIFNDEINEDFSNGITVFDSSSYDDEVFWSMYSLHTYDNELHDDFDEYINKRRIVKGEEIA